MFVFQCVEAYLSLLIEAIGATPGIVHQGAWQGQVRQGAWQQQAVVAVYRQQIMMIV